MNREGLLYVSTVTKTIDKNSTLDFHSCLSFSLLFFFQMSPKPQISLSNTWKLEDRVQSNLRNLYPISPKITQIEFYASFVSCLWNSMLLYKHCMGLCNEQASLSTPVRSLLVPSFFLLNFNCLQ